MVSVRKRKRTPQGGARTNLVRMLKGNIEVELSQDEELTLHHAVP